MLKHETRASEPNYCASDATIKFSRNTAGQLRDLLQGTVGASQTRFWKSLKTGRACFLLHLKTERFATRDLRPFRLRYPRSLSTFVAPSVAQTARGRTAEAPSSYGCRVRVTSMAIGVATTCTGVASGDFLPLFTLLFIYTQRSGLLEQPFGTSCCVSRPGRVISSDMSSTFETISLGGRWTVH